MNEKMDKNPILKEKEKKTPWFGEHVCKDNDKCISQILSEALINC